MTLSPEQVRENADRFLQENPYARRAERLIKQAQDPHAVPPSATDAVTTAASALVGVAFELWMGRE